METKTIIPKKVNPSGLRQVIDETLQAYRELVGSFSEEFQGVVSEYFPLYRGSPSLVTYSAFLIAEPFGIDEYEIIRKTGLAALCFDHFTHLLDDATDSNDVSTKDSALRYHTATTLFLKGIRIAHELVEDTEKFDLILDNYWQQASLGERHLWRHHKKVFPYDSQDMKMLGKRGSMAKVPIAIYSGVKKREERIKPLEAAIENTAIAIQLLDDLFDWREDLRDGIYTHPIALASKRLNQFDISTIEQGLFFEGAFNEVLGVTQTYLKNAKHNFDIVGANQASELVRSFSGNISQVKDLVDSLKSIDINGRDITSYVKEHAFPLLTSH